MRAQRRGISALVALAVVAAIALAAYCSPASASEASPVPVSIEATVTQPFIGVWQASGGITDSGTFARTGVRLTGSFFNAPTVGAFQADFEFSGSQGTFALRDELLGSASGINGNWQIVSGTGAYERLSGHGTSSFDFATSTVFFTGVVS